MASVTRMRLARFVDIVRQYTASEISAQEALNAAIEYCIEHNILRDFLNKYQAEVLGMLLEEFDKEKYERTIRNEGRQQQQEVVVRQLFSKGLAAEEIADLLDLSEEQVKNMLH